MVEFDRECLSRVELQSITPSLHYELIPDAGHGFLYDKPARLGVAALAFLTEATAIAGGATSTE
jgi:hypothetical protein